jgi:hypothetical protein
MNIYGAFLEEAYTHLCLPTEAENCLRAAWQTLCESEDATKDFLSVLEDEQKDMSWEAFYHTYTARLDAISIEGVHAYTLHALFTLCCFCHLRADYEKMGYPEALFWGAVQDLSYKINECQRVRGVWGTTALGNWYRGFFVMELFAIGRLQYQVKECDFDFDCEKGSVKKGDRVYGIHIPSAGPLLPQAVLDSMRAAKTFFGEKGVIRFTCGSWMLMKDGEQIFPEGTNLRSFYDLFEKVSYRVDEGYHNCWRIFDTDYDGNPDHLPQNSGLQKRLVAYLKAGGTPTSGTGICFFAD